MKTLTDYIRGLDLKKLKELRKLVSAELRKKENQEFFNMVNRKKRNFK